jgi:hypothetical protein
MDPVYIPLVAAGIAGGVNLIGLLLAALVLRHNLRSQGNPLKLEAHKYQAEAIVRFTTALLKTDKILSTPSDQVAVSDGTTTPDELIKQIEELHCEYKIAVLTTNTLLMDSMHLTFMTAAKLAGALISKKAEVEAEKNSFKRQ